ncbi:hypothetical protein [Microbacterium sp. 1.5R]|uniref:hypothetical protein n=1 Tax=Microbacterium sp. 1.5R TaxID=1916917 RepID=UPI0011A52CAD|nr:hypothetical protein [Microbacterium sp. 1.5R]
MSEPQQPPAHPQGTPPSPHGQPAPQPGQPYSQPAQPYSQPAQPYAQPGQLYSQPGQGYPGASASAPSPSSSGGALGRVAFIVAIASLAIGLLIALSTPILIRAASFTASSYGLILGVSNFGVLIVAAVALVLGVVALRRPGQRILAGIAIGIAASEVLGILVAWLSNLVLTLTYS